MNVIKRGGVMRSLLLMFALVAGCSSDEASRESRCERLRDHLIDLRVSEASPAEREAHRQILQQSLGSDFASSCSDMREDQLDCALNAADNVAVIACSGKSTK